jgi:hypothetical protein
LRGAAVGQQRFREVAVVNKSGIVRLFEHKKREAHANKNEEAGEERL